MNVPDLELISFPVCPFVMRARIALGIKNMPYRITHIDLSDKPDWFMDISPFGKVPVLRVDNESVIFESQVICEYINEITPESLYPDDALLRASNRSWIELASQMTMANFAHLSAGVDRQESTKNTLNNLLARLEAHLSGTRYFNGDELSMVDAAFAPFFVQLECFNQQSSINLLVDYPKVQQFSEVLWSEKVVQDVLFDGFSDELVGVLTAYGSAYFA